MRMWIVDAFADRAFAGAQAAVVPLDSWLSDEALQAIATECRMPETAFFAPKGAKGGYELRWFTPQGEAPISGHAALAAGAVLLSEIEPNLEIAVFDTQSGALVVRKDEAGFTLDLPRKSRFPWDPPAGLAEALGGANIEDAFGAEYATIVLPSEAAVRRLEPDMEAIARLVRGPRAGCLAITAQADEDKPYDFVTRFFAPGLGVAEEAAIGGSFADIAPYWCDRLGLEEAVGLQCSQRGGAALARPSLSTVRLLGQAAVFLRGEIDGKVAARLVRKPRATTKARRLPSFAEPEAVLLPEPPVSAEADLTVRVLELEADEELIVSVYELEPAADGSDPAVERIEISDLSH